MSQAENVYRILRTHPRTRSVGGGVKRWTIRTYPDVPRCKFTILCVALLRERLPKVRVKVFHHISGGVEILKEKEDKGELIKEVDAENRAPES